MQTIIFYFSWTFLSSKEISLDLFWKKDYICEIEHFRSLFFHPKKNKETIMESWIFLWNHKTTDDDN